MPVSFSNKYLNDFEKLKNSVIGFEFEFYTNKSYFKLMEYLGNELAPIKIHGFRKYHSKFKPDENNYKIEPDLSGGYEMVEIVSGPMPYVNAKIMLLKVLKILQDVGRTDERCSIHINVSFDKNTSVKVLDKGVLVIGDFGIILIAVLVTLAGRTLISPSIFKSLTGILLTNP